jgi:Fur family ferric uptake transcriptional regulator
MRISCNIINAIYLHLVQVKIYRTILSSVKLKSTTARTGVLDILVKADQPLGVPEIADGLKRQGIEVDRATLYRILEVFFQRGIVTKLELQEGKFRYELAGSDHHHLICERCGAIADISDCDSKKWEKEIKRKKGFVVKRHALEFFGICKQCQQ